jgi:hypothetical protein
LVESIQEELPLAPTEFKQNVFRQNVFRQNVLCLNVVWQNHFLLRIAFRARFVREPNYFSETHKKHEREKNQTLWQQIEQLWQQIVYQIVCRFVRKIARVDGLLRVGSTAGAFCRVVKFI